MYFFDQWAQRIAGGDVLGREVYHPLGAWQLAAAALDKWQAWYGTSPVFYKAPFYPYLIAILYRVFGDAIFPLALLQILAAGASTLLLGDITRRIFGDTAGLGAAIIYALYAPDVHFDTIMLRGPWIVLASLLGTWLLLRLRDRPGARLAAGLGVATAIAILVNEAFLIVPLLIGVLLLWWFGRSRPVAILAGAFILGIVVTFAPLVIRNVMVRAPPLKLVVTGSTVYAVFNAAGSSPYFFQVNPAAFVPIVEASHGELLATMLGCLRSFASTRDVLAFYLHKAYGLAIPFENPDNANIYYAELKSRLLGVLPNYAVLLPVGVVGLALAARR